MAGLLPQQVPAAALPVQSEAQSDAQYAALRMPAASTGVNDRLYVGNTGNNSITVYLHSAAGNTAPLAVIAGPKTGIDSPGQLAQDAQGNLYVANGRLGASGSHPGILVFAHGASGNVSPIRKLTGAATEIGRLEAMTVDKTTGKLYISTDTGVDFPESGISLLRFAPNANGNMAPFARGAVSFPAVQLDSASGGINLIEAHSTNAPSVTGFGEATLFKQFANGTPPAMPTSIGDLYAYGIADDPTTKTYLVTTGSGGIYRLAEGTTGSGPLGGKQELTPAPVSVITNDTCGGQLAVAPGPTPYTYVVHAVAAGCPTNAVYVYANSASGNATPVRILSGSATQMDAPYGIAEGP